MPGNSILSVRDPINQRNFHFRSRGTRVAGNMKNRSFSKRVVYFVLFVVISLSITTTVQAVLMSLKISGSMTIGGDVHNFTLSPDGQTAVFLADSRVNSVNELFAVNAQGGTPIPLSPLMTTDNMVVDFVISPNSQQVVYWTGSAEGETTGLYAVPIHGGTRTDLDTGIPAQIWLEDIAISPNNVQVVYTLDNHAVSPNIEVLWRVPLAGGTALALSSTTINPYGISIIFKITPDSAAIIYRTSSMFTELFQTDMEGNHEILALYDIGDFDVNSDTVVFM